MSTAADKAIVRTSESPRLRPVSRVGDIWAFREILVNLVRKELKVKYTKSVLGAAWSMLNPILYLAVFSFVFTVVLKSDIPAFPVYLLSGLIAWNFFSGSLTLASRAVVDNTSLVKKVYFPREILPLASVGTALVDFLLQLIVLIAFMLVFRYDFIGVNTLLFFLAMPALVLFTTAISLWVSAINVTYRDTQHLLNLVLLAWFWLTPVVYKSAFLQNELSKIRVGPTSLFGIYIILNPVADVVLGFQRAFYTNIQPPGASTPVLANLSLGELSLILSAVIVASLGLLLLTWRSFFKRSGDFAEEL